ncbi:DUF4190 domain-containing protein [Mycobacteroides franklinii]|uniref:DUF4190 domain-containing protein n=1 Tax=Mycobacteroides franklinii TaxID=948102 RepID=A0A4R8R7R3_9MYCO|nr:DUF4190 domain-containing protein [Mycobacteroides franklinii]TDZ41996.1 hypothetical protein CCUG64054_02030 [Mycobacteroides franklinii]TDZ52144.1 hypothetical protein CCUG63697_00615 [Mycobacteroides franklinii]TDZ55551.1 hypothetical protein CCUG63696_02033 [Mycobacteroides franklinii]TDZ62492.1 hypothetical protein CCUG63695_01957 [Mycobacteroides franklinii]TDZ68889.1 hypothetical protein CCUG64056_02030 [Mycobacteroides franklinii]
MTTPGNEHSGASPDPSSGYEYPSLEKSAPPADAASTASQAPPNVSPAWETPGAPQSYPAYPSYPSATYPSAAYPTAPPTYPTAPPPYPTAPPAYPQYSQGYPSYQPGQPGAYPPTAGYPVAGGYPGYPAPGYADPYGYGAYGPTAGTNGLAIASLITSIAAIVTCYLGIILGIVGVILGVIALNQLKTRQQDGKGIAIAGIILGAVIPVLWIVVLIIIAAGSSGTSGSY